MTPLLPRFHRALEAIDDERAISRAILESAPHDNPNTTTNATLAGDPRRLRGIPAVARGVPGVSPGTHPEHCPSLRTIR